MPATSLDLSQIKTDALSSASAFRALIGLGTLATQSATITDYLTIASAASTYQPLDSDLTSIAALTTTAFGRSLLTEVSATTARSTLGLGTLATQSPTGTPSASTFLRGDYSWQTIDLSGYVPYSGATGAVNLGSNAFTASRATLATGTITTSTPALNVTQTWNNAATTFTGILANVTDTASNAASLLMDLQVGGSSRAVVTKGGFVRCVDNFNSPGLEVFTDGSQSIARNTNARRAYLLAAFGLAMGRDLPFSWSANQDNVDSLDLVLRRDAAQTLAQRNGLNPQVHRVYNTFTDSSNYERAKIAWESNVLRIGTEKAGTGSARALELQTDGVTRLTIDTSGNTTLASGTSLNVGGATTACLISSNSGVARIDFLVGGSYVGNINSSSNTLRLRAPSGVAVRNNNDTADAAITAAAATFSGNVTISAVNIVTDTTTGTKIGTATTQKLGFYNATPVVQPTAVADATDAASVITQLNALLSRMRNLGLIAT